MEIGAYASMRLPAKTFSRCNTNVGTGPFPATQEDLADVEQRLTQGIDALATRFDAKVYQIIVLLERGTGVNY